MKLLVQEYLNHHTFQQLEDEHGVNARPNGTFDKFTLNYDMIDARPGDSVSEQCRGLVIRPKLNLFGRGTDEWKDVVIGEFDVLARPMDRFYNHGDPHAVEIDWSHPSLKVYEKVDGTCIIMYWDPLHDKWHTGTRSVPEADLPIQVGHLAIGDTTFSGLFWTALEGMYDKGTQDGSYSFEGWIRNTFDKSLTYVFELVSPYNQIVVTYPEPLVYLLAVRRTVTGEEIPIEDIVLEHVKRPQVWSINDVTALATFVDQAEPSKLEGAVVCVQVGDSFKREKVKNKTYVLAHKAKDTVMSSERNALECVILEKVDDIVPLVPRDVGDKLLRMQYAFGRYCKQIDKNVIDFKAEAAGSRKRFAEQVMTSGDWTAPYFNMWENKAANAREWFSAASKNNKLSVGSLDTILSKLDL